MLVDLYSSKTRASWLQVPELRQTGHQKKENGLKRVEDSNTVALNDSRDWKVSE